MLYTKKCEILGENITNVVVGKVLGRFFSKDRYEQNLSIYAVNCPNTGLMFSSA